MQCTPTTSWAFIFITQEVNTEKRDRRAAAGFTDAVLFRFVLCVHVLWRALLCEEKHKDRRMHACDRTRRRQQHLWDLGTTEVLVRRTTHCVARAQLLVYSEAKRYHNTSTEVEAMLDSSSVQKKKKVLCMKSTHQCCLVSSCTRIRFQQMKMKMKVPEQFTHQGPYS